MLATTLVSLLHLHPALGVHLSTRETSLIIKCHPFLCVGYVFNGNI